MVWGNQILWNVESLSLIIYVELSIRKIYCSRWYYIYCLQPDPEFTTTFASQLPVKESWEPDLLLPWQDTFKGHNFWLWVFTTQALLVLSLLFPCKQ